MQSLDQQAARNTFSTLLWALQKHADSPTLHRETAEAIANNDDLMLGRIVRILFNGESMTQPQTFSFEHDLFGGDIGESVPAVVTFSTLGGYIHIETVQVMGKNNTPFDLFLAGFISDEAFREITHKAALQARESLCA